MKRILTVFGTRPEAIKMAPVLKALRKRGDRIESPLCVTAQHREMLDSVLQTFGLEPDFDLDLMRHGQSPSQLLARILDSLDPVLAQVQPDALLVHGDTTTTLGATLAAFHHKIPVGHVEAGLRTGDLYSPFPEEGNRHLVDHLARWHFSPTEGARANLLAEGVAPHSILVTGNTSVDALLITRRRVQSEHARWREHFEALSIELDSDRKMVLITAHRRESFGRGLRAVFTAMRNLVDAWPRVDFVYPVHLNPQVQEQVNETLRPAQRSNLHLIAPQPYPAFVALLDRCQVVLTDSGGLQEEAPGLGKPVLVMRRETERPEAISAGTALLVGTDPEMIFLRTSELLDRGALFRRMSNARNPYGDGEASERIVRALL